MQRFLLGCSLVALAATAHAQTVDNPCIENVVTNCTTQASVDLAPGAPTPLSVCLGQLASLCLSNVYTAGIVETTTTHLDCSVTSTSQAVNATVLSNWWQGTVGNHTVSGSGLCAAFTPTNAGTGSVTFYTRYSSDAPCSTQPTTKSNVVAITVTAEHGPHAASPEMIIDGSVLSAGTIEYTNVTVCVGGPVYPPDSYGVTFNNGLKRHWVSYDCPVNTNLNHWETNAVIYTASEVYFDPPMPAVFTTPQTNTYIAKVNGIPSDGVCSVISNIVIGSVTVVVASTEDSDYDGFSDCDEIRRGTDPFSVEGSAEMWLGFWTFNTNSWEGEFGQSPILATNLQILDGYTLKSVMVGGSSNAALSYKEIETNGWANINLRQGTLRFWFRPNWSSTSQGGGVGPQSHGRLIEVGNESAAAPTGWWSLLLNPAGTELRFVTQSTGAAVTNLTATVNWKQGEWHQVALTYSATSSSLYIDGTPVATNGMGVSAYPGHAVRSQGFRIGSDGVGQRKANGRFDDLETFSFPIPAAAISNSYAWAAAQRTSSSAANANACVLRPITVQHSLVTNLTNGATLTMTRGTGAGNFSWVETVKTNDNGKIITGNSNPRAMAEQLTNNVGFAYMRFNAPGDTVLSIGDPLAAIPGNKNANGIRNALQYLKTNQIMITLPLWSTYSGTGNNLQYTVSGYANFILTNYGGIKEDNLSGPESTFTFVYYGTETCDQRSNAAPQVFAGQDISVCATNTVTLSGNATDDGLPTPPNLTYAWSTLWGPAAVSFGANTSTNTTATFPLPGLYRLQLFASDGELSGTDTVDVTIKETTTASGPTNQVACSGGSVLLSVAATGSGPFSYIWRRNGDLIAGETNSVFSITNVSTSSAGTYVVEVTGACNSVTNSAQLDVVPQLTASGPANATVCSSSTVVFEVTPSGATPVSFVWRKNGIVLSGRTNSTITLTNVLGNDAGTYSAEITGTCNSVTNSGILAVLAPTVASALTNLSVDLGENAIFSTVADGAGPFTYVWRKDGSLVAGQTTNTLVITNVTEADLGSYSVEVSGYCNAVTNQATLSLDSNLPLTVSIFNPTNNQTFLAPASIVIEANASDPDGGISRVEFFANGLLIGTDSLSASSPYRFVWVGVPSNGTNYNLTARAVDLGGNAATSSVVSVHVVPRIAVDAGPDQLIVLTNETVSTLLDGSITGGTASRSSAWVQIGGPVASVIDQPTAPDSAAVFNAAGTYSFRLSASDEHSSAADTMTVTVATNAPPTVDAGPNRIISPGNLALLNGRVSDDGFPQSPGLTSWWTISSAPTGGVTFTNASTVVTVASNLMVEGIYTFRLHASDGLATVHDEMTVTVTPIVSRTYTLNADFAEGAALNVNFDERPHELRLNHKVTPFPYVWVACSGRNTAVRIDANTGQILGEYRTTPETRNNASPSRTTVDKHGNVWIANRSDDLSVNGVVRGSITRIALVIGGTRGYKTNDLGGTNYTFVVSPTGQWLKPPFWYSTAVDRDGDGLIKTSSGLDNVLSWGGSSTSNDLGGVSLAEDECIINFTRVNASGVRLIAIDRNNDVWIGGHHNKVHEQLSGITGGIIPNTTFTAVGGSYGGFIDGNGILWSANSLIRFDINRRFDTSVYPYSILDHKYVGEALSAPSYGLGIDPNTGEVWSSHSGMSASRISPDGTTFVSFQNPSPIGAAGGLAVDSDNNVWVASHYHGNGVAHFKTDGTFVGNIDFGCGVNPYGPTGVAVDSNGKIWTADHNSRTATRIDPLRGPRMLNGRLDPNGFPLGEVDLRVNLDSGKPGIPAATPYNYSDMTGFIALGATEPSGVWQVVHDSGSIDQNWGVVKWTCDEPEGTAIRVEVRAAAEYAQLSATNNVFQHVTNGVPFSGLVGRYLEVRATFSHKLGNENTPVLYDLTVSSGTEAIIAEAATFAQDDRRAVFQNSVGNIIDVLGNDNRPGNSALSISKVSPPKNGYVINHGTNLIYTPEANFFGKDQFTYTANDGNGGLGRAVVTVSVGRVEPPPSTNYFAPIARSDTNLFVSGNSIDHLIAVMANDQDTNSPTAAITIVSTTKPSHGLARVGACGVYYTPNRDYYGADSFTYTIRNAHGHVASARVELTVVGQPQVIACDTTINGKLAQTNSAMSKAWPGSYSHLYTFAGDPSKAVTISLEGWYFSGSATLSNPEGNTVATTYIFEGESSPIVYVPRSTNIYTIEISSNWEFSSEDYTFSFTCTNAIAPHLSVFLGTNVVAPGAKLDYGVTYVGHPVSALLTITNFGTSNLVISSASISPGGVFELVGNSLQNQVLSAGGSTNVTLRYSATSPGETNGEFILYSNDGDVPSYRIHLVGRANRTNTIPPTIVITNPVPGTTYTASEVHNWETPIRITALTEAAPGSSILGVNYFATTTNGTRIQIGQVTTPDYDEETWEPIEGKYSFDWAQNVPPGRYLLGAVSVDNFGLSAASEEIPITVLHRATNAPHMKVLFFGTNDLPNNSLVNFGIAHTNSHKEVSLTISNAGASTLFVNNLTFSSPEFRLSQVPTWPVALQAGAQANLVVVFSNAVPGSYEGRELYIDSNDEGLFGPYNGNQSSGRMKLRLVGVAAATGTPPSIDLTYPGSNSVFGVSSNIVLKANATASSGATITAVEFYAAVTGGYLKIDSAGHQQNGVYHSSPWNPGPGQYEVLAVVRDSSGRAAQSPLVPISFLARPTNAPVLHVFLNETNRLLNQATIDYGLSTVGLGVTTSLTLSNAGVEPLSISGLAFSNAAFAVTSQLDLPLSIGSGAATNIALRYLANTIGEARGLLTIYNNDPATHPFYLTNLGRANPANVTAPNVVITAPADGVHLAYPSDATISVVAQGGTNARLASVDVFGVGPTNTVLIGTILSSSPGTNISGTVTWNRPSPGLYSLKAVARDQTGTMGESTNLVRIRISGTTADGTNAPPIARDDLLVLNTCPGNCPTYTVDVLSNDSDPNNDRLTVTSVGYSGNLGRVVQDGNKILFTPNQNYWGIGSIFYTISDNRGGEAFAWVDIDMRLIPVPSVSLVEPEDGEYIELSSQTASRMLLLKAEAQANNVNGTIARVEFYSGDTYLGATSNSVDNQFTFQWKTPPSGPHALTAVAFDNDEQSKNSEPVTIYIAGKPGNNLPLAALTNVAEAVFEPEGLNTPVYPIITEGVIDLRGHARDVDVGDVVRYQLLLYSTDGEEIANLTPGADPDGYRNGTDSDGVLGTNIDLSRFENGIYDIVLNVVDGWERSSDTARILLNSQLKIGHFSFSVKDVVIPVSGIPLTVARTYNSLNPRSGDFGYSWTYALSEFDVQIDEYRRKTLDITTVNGFYSLRVGGGRNVTLTLPDGKRTTFQFYFDGPIPCNTGFMNPYCYEPKWRAPAGVNYTLSSLTDVTYNAVNGAWDNAVSTSFDNYDIPGFVLTAEDGTKYIIEREDLGEHFVNNGVYDDYGVHAYGKASLTQIIQPDGNRIEFLGNEIRHYNPSNVVSRSVFLERDRQGRIVAVRDPVSGDDGLPVVKYTYDPVQGNLTEVAKLTDRSANNGLGAYDLTRYEYTNSAFPHYITGILDPRGVPLARNEYYDDGRLKAIVDSSGRRTEFIHNLDSRVEIVVDRRGNTNSVVYDLRGNIIAQTNALGAVTQMSYDNNNRLKSVTDPLTNTVSYSYDDSGNRTNVVDALNRTNTFKYNSFGQLLAHTDPVGNLLSNRYDQAGLLLETVRLDSGGRLLSRNFSDYEGGLLVQTRNASNQVTASFAYDNYGNRTNVTDANNLSRAFLFDENGRNTNVSYVWTGPAGNQKTVSETIEYDAAGRAIRRVDSDQNVLLTVYNSFGKIAHTVDKFGNTNTFLYDARGSVIQTVYPDGTLTRTVYDEDSRPAFVLSRNSLIGAKLEYDAVGRVTNQVKLLNLQIQIVADSNNAGQVVSTVASEGTVVGSTATEYYPNGWVKARIGYDGGRTEYDYWPDGQLKSVTDPLTNTTQYAYENAGQHQIVTDALNRTNQFVYDGAGRLIKTMFHDGTFTTNRFDVIGNQVGVEDAAGLLKQFAYNTSGQVTNVILPEVADPQNGNSYTNVVWSYSYDQYGDLRSIIDPKGRLTEHTHDAGGPGSACNCGSSGSLVSRKLPLGQNETNIFNSKGLLWKTYDFKGQKTELYYDKFGRLRSKFLFEAGSEYPSNAVCYVYNQLGQLWKVIDRSGPDATTNSCDGYLAVAGVPSRKPGAGQSAASWGQPSREFAGVSLALPLLLFAWFLVPGETRRAAVLELRKQIVSQWGRGPLGVSDGVSPFQGIRLRLPSLACRFTSLIVVLALIGSDPSFGVLMNAKAQCTVPQNSSTETIRITEFAYDHGGRLAQVNSPESVVNYRYDDATGRLVATCTANSEVGYGYDKLGRLETVTVVKRNGALLPQPEVTTYTYTKVGSRETVMLPNGILSTYKYDSLNRLTNLVHASTNGQVLAEYAYLLHSTGKRTNAFERLLQQDGSYRTNKLHWQYDALYRLTNEMVQSSASGGSYTNSYQYDLAGNRLKKLRKLSAQTETISSFYNDNDHLEREEMVGLDGNLSTNFYKYDDNGALTEKVRATASGSATNLYGYNLAGKLSSVSANGNVTTFRYDHAGARVSSKTGSSSTYFVVDSSNPSGYAQVLEELGAPRGGALVSYVIGADVLGQASTSAQAQYLLRDGHGSTRQLSQSNDDVLEQYNYDAFGASLATLDNPQTSLLFSGERFDPALQMYDQRARFYDPQTGRFNQMDPMPGNNSDPQSLHRYLYCHADPVNNVDPTGYFSVTEMLMSTKIALDFQIEFSFEVAKVFPKVNTIVQCDLALAMAVRDAGLAFLDKDFEFGMHLYEFGNILAVDAFKEIQEAVNPINVYWDGIQEFAKSQLKTLFKTLKPGLGHWPGILLDTFENQQRMQEIIDTFNSVGWTIDNDCEKAQVFELAADEIFDLQKAFLKGAVEGKKLTQVLADWLKIEDAIEAGEHYTGRPIF